MAKVPVWLSSQDSKLWLVLSRIGIVFGLVMPVIAIVSLLLTGDRNVPATILAVYVCLLTTALVALLLRQENRYRREVKYAPALGPMRRAFTGVAEASWNLFNGDQSEDAFRLRLQESLQYFAAAFSLITDNTCRASIKLIRVPAAETVGDIQVFTLCRDNDDAHRDTVTSPDRIGDNTDFKQIFTEADRFFFCNDLPAQLAKGYRNSHWDEHTIESGRFDYRSTIVWPIERAQTIRSSVPSPREIIGFLCVDTNAVGAFHQTYDVAMGAAFSQALHLALHRFRSPDRRTDTTSQPSATTAPKADDLHA